MLYLDMKFFSLVVYILVCMVGLVKPTIQNREDLVKAVVAGSLKSINISQLFIVDLGSYPTFNETIKVICANPATKIFKEIYREDKSTPITIDSTKDIVFLIHGWLHDHKDDWISPAANGILKYRKMNVCLVDYGKQSHTDYLTAVVRITRIVAKHLTDFIESLQKFKIKPSQITIVGHSLGGQIAGFVGKNLQGGIKQIIGLDVAGPLFTIPIPLPIEYRLDASDAQAVQCVHSGDFLQGITIPCGGLDFYGNTGAFPQIGCRSPDIIKCSHYRATDWFVSSLDPRTNYCNGIQCDNLIAYGLRMCKSVYNKLGFDANPRVKGRFFFATAGKPTCSGTFYNSWSNLFKF